MFVSGCLGLIGRINLCCTDVVSLLFSPPSLLRAVNGNNVEQDEKRKQRLIQHPRSCCCCCCVSPYFSSGATSQPGVMETCGSASGAACGAECKHTCGSLKKEKETWSEVWLREGLKNIFHCGRRTAGSTSAAAAAAAEEKSMLLEPIFTFNRTKCCTEVVSEWKLPISFLGFFLCLAPNRIYTARVSFKPRLILFLALKL